jgi:hypothetical protein
VALGVATLLAVPILIKDRGPARSNSPAAVSATAGGNIAAGLDGAASASQPASDSSIHVGFLGAPAVTATTQPVVIGVPAPDSATSATGKAGFRRWAPDSVASPRPCATSAVPLGTPVLVTNLDNGHTAYCTVVSAHPTAANQLIQLDSSVFAELADLIDSPIPVRINW